MYAVAIANNDMVYLYWYVETKIEGCLGFSVVRHDMDNGESEALPAMVGFPGDEDAGKKFRTTNEWPLQKYGWKDLYAKRGGAYWYEIVPLIGKPGALKPLQSRTLRSNTVRVRPEHGNCSIYFNRGIISTQAIARNLPKGKDGAPSVQELQQHVAIPNDPFRVRLMGNINEGVLQLLERAAKEASGECYCALYELTDQELIDHLKGLGKKVHLVLSNADTSEKKDGKTVKVVDGENQGPRSELHKDKLDLADRILGAGHIGHNKFVVYVNKDGPQAVLAGSTNWTPTGLCGQSNNAIIINSPEVAGDYLKYWKTLKADTKKADGDSKELQGPDFRKANSSERAIRNLTDDKDHVCGTVRVWFSPNTRQSSKPAKNPQVPPDLKEVFRLIENAKQGVLFLAFIPGSPSIVTKLKEVYTKKRKAKQQFFVRGAATSPDPASLFKVDLFHRTMESDARVTPPPDADVDKKGSAKVDSVAGIYEAFASWEKEIYRMGFAVIHDKIVVIDPFTDDCVVVTGSHNLGYKASYSNDENMLIIRGNRGIAEAYTAHVLDVYDHYRWRWRLQEAKKQKKHADLSQAWHELKEDDSWQDFFYEHKDFLAPETLFWSPFEGASRTQDGSQTNTDNRRRHSRSRKSPRRS
ncbi:MAG TPA: phospholipase D-like domain-containing protein [Gemmataceae bacterium]|jgi:phosphatidylserine/phosphatidylglycerophosphate/cardiolipin synthase-like enzyme